MTDHPHIPPFPEFREHGDPARPDFVEHCDMYFLMMQMWRAYGPEDRDTYFDLRRNGKLRMQMHFLTAEDAHTGQRLRWLVMCLKSIPYPIHLDMFSKGAFDTTDIPWRINLGMPPDLKKYIIESETVGLGHFANVHMSLSHRGVSRCNHVDWTLVLVDDYIL